MVCLRMLVLWLEFLLSSISHGVLVSVSTLAHISQGSTLMGNKLYGMIFCIYSTFSHYNLTFKTI
jgi:hypothetical protein